MPSVQSMVSTQRVDVTGEKPATLQRPRKTSHTAQRAPPGHVAGRSRLTCGTAASPMNRSRPLNDTRTLWPGSRHDHAPRYTSSRTSLRRNQKTQYVSPTTAQGTDFQPRYTATTNPNLFSRCEFSLSTMSTPPLLACASTANSLPKSRPTTDIVLGNMSRRDATWAISRG